MADGSLAVRRLGFLLAKIRDALRQFWDSFRSTLASGRTDFPSLWTESAGAITNPWTVSDSSDIDTAAAYLCDMGLKHDAERLSAAWGQWETLYTDVLRNIDEFGGEFRKAVVLFCGELPDPNDATAVNRQVVLVRHVTLLSGLLDELIGTVEAMSPPADVAALATGSFFTPGSPKPAEDRPPPDPEHSDEETKPRWDSERRELSYGGIACKTFRQRAPNQELVLAAFEEVGWPPRIDDPIPPSGGVDQRQRLADTVRALNANHGTLRFELDGTGEGVIWKPVPNESRSVTDTSELPF